MANQRLKSIMRLIDSSRDNLPVEQAFLNDLCRSIEMTDKKNARMPSKSYKPSSMNCIRNMYYQITGCPVDEGESNYTLVGICNSGSDIHKRIQDAVLDMKNNGMDCEYINVADYVRNRNLDYLEIVEEPNPEKGVYETKLFHKDLHMSFLCDGIVKYKGIYYILELKTESSFKWSARTDSDPKHHHQGTAYSIAFQIPDVLFVYISRDLLTMKAYKYTPTDDEKMNLLGLIYECDGYVEDGVVPPVPDDVPKSACQYCNYRGTCGK